MNYVAVAIRLCTALVTFAAGTLAYFVLGTHTPPARPAASLPPPHVLVAAPPRTCAERMKTYLSNGSTASERIAQADDIEGAECYAEAEMLLRDAVRLDPSDTEAYYNLGYLYDELGRFDESAEVLEKGLRLDPDDAQLNTELGYALNALGRHSEAIAPLMRDLRAEPQDAYVRSALSDAFRWMGRRTEARSYARAGVSMGTENADEPALDNAALTLLDLGRSDSALTGEAEEAIHKALDVEPNSLYANYAMGTVMAAQGREAESASAYESVAAAAPDTPYEYIMRGWALMRVGREREAADDARHYLELVEWKGHNAADAAVLAYFALRHDGRDGEARAVLGEAAAHVDASTFGGKLVACLRGELTESKLFAAAKDEADLTAAHGYLGLKQLLDSDSRWPVVRNLSWVSMSGTRQFIAYGFVVAEEKKFQVNY